MSEAQLQKLQLERDALAAELRLVQGAIPPAKASQLLVQYCQAKQEPFAHAAGGAPVDNEWIRENNGERPCCSIA